MFVIKREVDGRFLKVVQWTDAERQYLKRRGRTSGTTVWDTTEDLQEATRFNDSAQVLTFAREHMGAAVYSYRMVEVRPVILKSPPIRIAREL